MKANSPRDFVQNVIGALGKLILHIGVGLDSVDLIYKSIISAMAANLFKHAVRVFRKSVPPYPTRAAKDLTRYQE